MQNTKQRGPIARALWRYRIEHGLTLEKISMLVELSISGFQKLEKGKNVPSDRTLHRLKQNLPGLAAMIEAEEVLQQGDHHDNSEGDASH